MSTVVLQNGEVLLRGGLVVDGDCPSCPTLPFAFTFVGAGGSPFVTGNLVWSATAVGGSDPGWHYTGDVPVCPGSSGTQRLSLREIVFWCDGVTWQVAIAYLLGTQQEVIQTNGGGLDDLTLTNPSSPRTYFTRDAGPDALCDDIGHIRFDVAVA